MAAAGPDALMVFAADKVSKVRELSGKPTPHRPSQRRMTHYRRCLELLERRLSDSPLVVQLTRGAGPADRAGAGRLIRDHGVGQRVDAGQPARPARPGSP